MQKIKEKLKKNMMLIIGIIVGLVIGGVGVYAAAVAANTVTYTNTTSKLSSTNVQGAVDELYEKATSPRLSSLPNIVAAYTYNETSCVTGDESTCVKTTCYKTKTSGSCPAGTIIDYKVNDSTIVRFHVMFDNGSTMTMQSQKNTLYDMSWNTSNDNTKGPTVVLEALENATSTWSNVNSQTYTLGTTSLSGKGAYTGCSYTLSCTSNTYTLDERTGNARMITVQEAVALGCLWGKISCPIWMYNYLGDSTSNGGTVNDTAAATAYHIMNADPMLAYYAWCVYSVGGLARGQAISKLNIRAVIEISK